PPLHRFRLGLEFALSGHRDLDGMIEHHAEMARLLAEQLRLDTPVLDAVVCSYEAWDGHGWPGRLRGEAIPFAPRITLPAEYIGVARRVGGVQKARELARERRGRQFDPTICDVLIEHTAEILGDLGSISTWKAVIDSEPHLKVLLPNDRFDEVLLAIANF